MKFTLEPTSGRNLVRGYSADEIRIGEQRVHRSCIVTAQQLITDWPPAAFSDLAPQHLEMVFALLPDVVVLASGTTQQFAPLAIRAPFAQRGIGLEVMPLGAACRTYNVLVQEDRRVVALLFPR
ncbi:MAG: Mth938-like domain-containing protein [Proteobacteria bacterium]|nr:Mth938-like domain-containing protein [Pseudomonadota bacterium]